MHDSVPKKVGIITSILLFNAAVMHFEKFQEMWLLGFGSISKEIPDFMIVGFVYKYGICLDLPLQEGFQAVS